MKLRALLWTIPSVAALFVAAGCGSGSNNPAGGPIKLKVAYLGLTCEAPIFVAEEKGFFKEEGLEVEMVKTDWDGLREGLAAGRFDANHTLVMYLLKPIEAGADVKITGGIHTGCLRLQAGVDSDIKTVKDLKGKRIGVPTHIGSPPYLFASRVLAANDIDPRPEKKDVEWTTYPPMELELALKQGKIDAVATSDPVGTMLIDKKVTKVLADQAMDEPYKDEYCCAAVVSGKLARENPKAAAKVTRALLKAAKWVNENPKAAAELSVPKYVGSDVRMNTLALSQLNYIPGVARCKKSVDQAAKDMRKAGLLKDTTDPEELAKRAWLDLDGVTDEWVNGLTVEKVADGGRPGPLAPGAFAALFEGRKSCCNCCCLSE